MTYTGDVQVGGPADVRELPGLTICKLAVGPYDNNAYLLRCTRTGDALLIDAAAESDRLLALIDAEPISTIVTTHQHGDHWQALEQVAKVTGARLVAHPLDAPALPLPVDRTVDHGDTIDVGEASLEVIHLRGHTPGSIALLYDGGPAGHHLFTGDCLFPGGVGNTGQDPERFEQLYTDVVERLFDRLPDETWVYPGHGKDTTLGAERPSLQEWKARGW
ncbi:MBL fold metallo-hydrolase [Nonomuraea sp. NN258]|uniref:MBL fold metallo-hydrolase n=1 Tax=Nonomuraea antri TaxID=2730852 RepID=UPI0015694327|nr:MBL fold metallo-hydrolase [Nonomuraea antri]NRQ39407.1 MBL fold metallo-hydrolase [Nonomuraea antri]